MNFNIKTREYKKFKTNADKCFVRGFQSKYEEELNSEGDKFEKIIELFKNTEDNIFKQTVLSFGFHNSISEERKFVSTLMCYYNNPDKRNEISKTIHEEQLKEIKFSKIGRTKEFRDDILKFCLYSSPVQPELFQLTEGYVYSNPEQLFNLFTFIKSFKTDLVLGIYHVDEIDTFITEECYNIILNKTSIKPLMRHVFWSNDLKTIIDPDDVFNITDFKFCYPCVIKVYSITDLGNYDINNFDTIEFTKVDYQTDIILPICKNVPQSDINEIHKVKSTGCKGEFFTKDLEDTLN